MYCVFMDALIFGLIAISILILISVLPFLSINDNLLSYLVLCLKFEKLTEVETKTRYVCINFGTLYVIVCSNVCINWPILDVILLYPA